MFVDGTDTFVQIRPFPPLSWFIDHFALLNSIMLVLGGVAVLVLLVIHLFRNKPGISDSSMRAALNQPAFGAVRVALPVYGPPRRFER
jgi:hypothetical protein